MAQSQSTAVRCTGCYQKHDDYEIDTLPVSNTLLNIEKIREYNCNKCSHVFRRVEE